MTELRKFFGHGSREVSVSEFGAFWRACSEEEKASFKDAVAYWDGSSQYIN